MSLKSGDFERTFIGTSIVTSSRRSNQHHTVVLKGSYPGVILSSLRKSSLFQTRKQTALYKAMPLNNFLKIFTKILFGFLLPGYWNTY